MPGLKMPEREIPVYGNRVLLTITSVKGNCLCGQQVGGQCEVSILQTGGICGSLYQNIYTKISMLEFGGQYPFQKDPDVLRGECIDPVNRVEVELHRMR